jgi:hypothetical protein
LPSRLAAFDAIGAMLLLGSVGYEPQLNGHARARRELFQRILRFVELDAKAGA